MFRQCSQFNRLSKRRYRSISFLRLPLAGVLVSAAMTVIALARPGDLDLTFDQDGRVFTNIAVPGFQYFYPNTESMLVQPDGKILVCGRFWEDGISYWYGTMIVRYMPNGALDSSFGVNGKVAVIGPGYPYGAQTVGADMTLQPDGKIVLIGSVTVAAGIIVQRYTASGVLDTTFGNNGTTVVSGIANPEGTSITLQPDGKIVGTGWEYALTQPYYDALLVFRLNTNGTLDSSFGSAGTGVVKIVDGYDGAEVRVQPDGKILVVGELSNPPSVPPAFLLARYNPDGSFDSNFGTGGKVIDRINNLDTFFYAAALQPDGRIVVAGRYSSGSEHHRVVIRYDSNGSLDTSFGTNGVVSMGSGFYGADSVLVQTDGKIVLTGNAYDGASGHNTFAIVRLNSNGPLDPSFGIGGTSVFPINAGGTNYSYASDGALQPDGKILVTGYFGFYYTDSHEKIALIRVNGGRSSTLFDFDGDGRSDISIFRPSDATWWYLRSSDGQVPAAQFGTGTDKVVAADYTGDGKTDIAFFRPSTGQWFILRSEDSSFYGFPFGSSDDVPTPADYDGDGKTDAAVFRPVGASWFILRSSDGGVTSAAFGINGDKPVPADYDGDGKADIGIYRPGGGTGGEWWIQRSTAGLFAATFGNLADKTVQGDWTGDGKADCAFFRPSNGTWYVLRSEGQSFFGFPFGVSTDTPAPGDYDGDGKFDAAVFRQPGAQWFINRSTGGVTSLAFGAAGDIPVPGAYVR